MRSKLLFFLLLPFLHACVNHTTPEAKELTIQAKNEITEQKFCQDSSHCVEYQADYLVFEGDLPVVNLLNARTYDFASGLFSPENESTVKYPLDSLGKMLISDYQGYLKDNKEGSSWGVEFKASTPFTSAQLITLDLNGYSYYGGAHPNSVRQLSSYEKVSGKELTAKELIKDTVKLVQILEKRYKEAKGVDPNSDLKEVTFDGSPLPLPQNMAIVKNGIMFYYNDYEVAAHAIGPTEIVLTWEELAGIALDNKYK
jgi:hypothetical protein